VGKPNIAGAVQLNSSQRQQETTIDSCYNQKSVKNNREAGLEASGEAWDWSTK
jgi:hypothetical protein